MHEQALLEARLRHVRGVFSLSQSGDTEHEWRVCESSSTYIGTEPWGIDHHVWRIAQVEHLACEGLLLGAVRLEPYDYREDVDERGVVRLVARARVAEMDLAALASARGPLDVTRVGISSQPRRMTLSYVWGARSDGLAVAVRCEDVTEPRVTLERSTGQSDELDDLLSVLQSRRILDATDVEELLCRRNERRRVADVDAWRL